MEPIIEIISKNILYNNVYDLRIKNEFINMINRINYIDRSILQYRRSMEYILLFNTLHEELKYMIDKKKYFTVNLKKDIKYIMKDLINYRINLLKKQLKIDL